MSSNLLFISDFGELPEGVSPMGGTEGFVRQHENTTEVICAQGDKVVHIMKSGGIGCETKGGCCFSNECRLNARKIDPI